PSSTRGEGEHESGQVLTLSLGRRASVEEDPGKRCCDFDDTEDGGEKLLHDPDAAVVPTSAFGQRRRVIAPPDTAADARQELDLLLEQFVLVPAGIATTG